MFRDFLHYNIKCAKAYLHSRLRQRTTSFIKVLNRAKPEQEGEADRKTARCVPVSAFSREREGGC